MRKKEIPESVKKVGENIEAIIKAKNLKLRNVAHDADMDTEALRRYIKASQIMGIDKAVSISKALEINIADLFEGIKG